MIRKNKRKSSIRPYPDEKPTKQVPNPVRPPAERPEQVPRPNEQPPYEKPEITRHPQEISEKD